MAIRCVQYDISIGRLVEGTWTALSPNPTRREPKRLPTEEQCIERYPSSSSNHLVTWPEQKHLDFEILCKRDSPVAKNTWVLRQRCRHCWMMKTNRNCQTNREQQLVPLHFYHLYLVFHQEPWFIWALKAWAPDLKSARGWRSRALYGWVVRCARWLVGWLGAFQSCSTLPGWQWNITWLGCALRADIWVKTKGTSEWSVLWKVFFCGIQEKKKLAIRHFTN